MSIRAIDVAYNLLESSKQGIAFKELWSAIVKEMGYDDKMASRKISQFYTDLSLDGRFANLGQNIWNLKTNVKYDEVAVSEEEYENDGEDSEEGSEDEEYTEEESENEEEEF